MDLTVNIAGLNFKNPVIAASGKLGLGREYADYLDLNRLGGISVKGLTLEQRRDNDRPDAETPVNLTVWASKPVHASKDESFLRKYFGCYSQCSRIPLRLLQDGRDLSDGI